MALTPEIDGAVVIQSSARTFAQAFTQRVAAGLLTGRPHPRSNYQVVEASPDRLRIEAADWWTAINVGLNELELWFPHTGSVRYRVRYWRWARYVIGLSGLLGVAGLALLVTFDVRGYVASHPSAQVPGLSLDQNLMVAWTMVLFWGFVCRSSSAPSAWAAPLGLAHPARSRRRPSTWSGFSCGTVSSPLRTWRPKTED